MSLLITLLCCHLIAINTTYIIKYYINCNNTTMSLSLIHFQKKKYHDAPNSLIRMSQGCAMCDDSGCNILRLLRDHIAKLRYKPIALTHFVP